MSAPTVTATGMTARYAVTDMNIIHFDLGTNMALAHNGCDGVVVTEHFVATGPRTERAAQTLRWLARRYREMKAAGITFNLCHYERPFSRGFDATRCGWGLAGVIEAVFGSDCAVIDSTPQSIKSFALEKIGKVPSRSKTKMKKAEREAAARQEKLWMIEAAQAMGYEGDNEHEADAFCGLKYAEFFAAHGEPPKPKRTRKKK
jgi:hypothetical protein